MISNCINENIWLAEKVRQIKTKAIAHPDKGDGKKTDKT